MQDEKSPGWKSRTGRARLGTVAMAGSAGNDTETLTEDGAVRTENGAERLWLRWCHPLPAPPPLALDRAKHTLGRDPACDARLASGHVSRFHAEIRRSGPIFAVFDRDSKNGVLVNGARVAEARLAKGDVINIGEVKMRFEASPV